MTDNEIIKALECCGRESCLGCPYRDGKCHQGNPMIRDAHDLINHLQAENEKNENIIRLADKTIETANAEIERLQNILMCFMGALGKVRKVDDIDGISLIPLMSELNKQYRAELKAQAYKEFADRLKELDGYYNHNFNDCVTLLVSDEYIKGRYEKINEIWSTIDNLLKEMADSKND